MGERNERDEWDDGARETEGDDGDEGDGDRSTCEAKGDEEVRRRESRDQGK